MTFPAAEKRKQYDLDFRKEIETKIDVFENSDSFEEYQVKIAVKGFKPSKLTDEMFWIYLTYNNPILMNLIHFLILIMTILSVGICIASFLFCFSHDFILWGSSFLVSLILSIFFVIDIFWFNWITEVDNVRNGIKDINDLFD